MPNPVPPTNPNGSLRSYTEEEIELMAIEHVGVEDGAHPTMVCRPNEKTLTAEYFCAYEELGSFICHMLGCAKIFPDPDNSDKDTLSRLLPQLYPGTDRRYAVGIEEVTGFQYTGQQEEDDGRPIYKKWRVRILYQQAPYDSYVDGVDPFEYKRFVQELPSRATTDYVTYPFGILKFQADGGGWPSGNPIQHNVGFVNPAVEIRKKWMRVPYDGWKEGSQLRTRVFGDVEEDIKPYLGTLNKTVIFGYAPGQLVLTGVEDELLLDPALEEQHWNITYVWVVKTPGHNWLKAFDPTGANAAKFCFVSNNGTYYETGGLPDGKSLFNAREHKDLYDVGEL